MRRPSTFDAVSATAWAASHVNRAAAGQEDEPLNGLVERARRDRAAAMLSEQMFEVRAGRLVKAEEVEQSMARLVREASVSFQALHSRLAGRHPALARQVFLDLDQEVRRILDELADGAARMSSADAHPLEAFDHDRDPLMTPEEAQRNGRSTPSRGGSGNCGGRQLERRRAGRPLWTGRAARCRRPRTRWRGPVWSWRVRRRT